MENLFELELRSCNDKNITSVVIPDYVTRIGDWAFGYCKSLKSVVIPPSVTKINMYAFDGCSSLESVEIPNSVTSIGVYAFRGCTSLKSVVIPDSVTDLCHGAFENCTSLEKVVLGDNLKQVYANTFYEANPNFEIVCNEGSSTYKAIKQCKTLKAHAKTLLLQEAKDKKIAEVQKAGAEAQISSLLEGREDSSFNILSSKKNETVVLVEVAKNVGFFKLGEDSSVWLPILQKVVEAFADSTKSGEDIFGVINEQNLPLAAIPAKKTKDMTLKADSDGSLNIFASGVLRKMEYDGVKGLALFGIKRIDDAAFKECKSLESVVIPNSVKKIGESSFGGCESLMSVEIPNSVMEIGSGAFYDCKSLASVEIPNSVTEIGDNAFRGCNISEFSHPCLTIKGGVAIQEDCFGHKVVGYCASQSSSITIPNGVIGIKPEAFAGCTSLKSVVIPYIEALMTSFSGIGYDAFYGCKSLKSMEFGGTVAQWEALVKGDDWHKRVPAKCVKCTDGEVKLA